MAWALSDESIRIQLFRFMDVLPALRDHQSISRHLEEYFDDIRRRLPAAARLGLEMSLNNSILSRALAFNVRSNASRMARRFVLGTTPEEILQGVRRLRRSGLACELRFLGPDVLSDAEASHVQTSARRSSIMWLVR